jgi:hypothetical protein
MLCPFLNHIIISPNNFLIKDDSAKIEPPAGIMFSKNWHTAPNIIQGLST